MRGGILDTTLKSIPPHLHTNTPSGHTKFKPLEVLKAFPLMPYLIPTFPNTSQLNLVLSIHRYYPNPRHQHHQPSWLCIPFFTPSLPSCATHHSHYGLWQPKWNHAILLNEALPYAIPCGGPQLLTLVLLHSLALSLTAPFTGSTHLTSVSATCQAPSGTRPSHMLFLMPRMFFPIPQLL